jgi:26S proteasome regulatory subunit N9
LGELLLHPILQFLERSEFKWLYELLTAFNAGNIHKFEQLSSSWSKHVN